MESDIANLENQLLVLTRRRVEIDSQWIAISEQLMTAKKKSSEAQYQEVPQVSEESIPNLNLPLNKIANTDAQDSDTRRGVSPHAEITAESKNTSLAAQRQGGVSNSAVVAQDVVNSPQTVHVEIPRQTFTLNASAGIRKLPEVPIDEPAGASPKNKLSPCDTHQERNQQESVLQHERQIPPPPTIIPTSTPSDAQPFITSPTPGMIHAQTTVSRPPPQHLQQPANDIELGNRQLLRTQRSGLNHPQPSSSILYTYPSTYPQSLPRMNSRIQPEWQPWQTQQQQILPYSPQIKHESLQGPSYPVQVSSAMSQDHAPGGSTFNRIVQSHGHALSPRAQALKPAMTFIPSQDLVGDVGHHPLVPAPFIAHQFELEPRASSVPRRRQRSPSLQITDIRPAQKPRLGDTAFRRDSTPKSRFIKVEEDTDPGRGESRGSNRSARAKAPPPRMIRPSETIEADIDHPFSQRKAAVHQEAVNAPTIAEHNNLRQQHTRALRRHRSPVPASQRVKVGRHINEDYDEDEEDENGEEDEEPVDDEFEVPDIQPQRQNLRDEDFSDLAEYDNEQSPLTAGLATRTTFGAPKPVQRAPLTLEEKHALELRYCARVAMVIGSKRCVMGPVEQISKTKNIFTIMKQKFGHVTEGEEPLPSSMTPYRNATDFVIDARGMLQCYVALGHCTPCPFRNPRVMCWRMRLESVLDQKMRGLKTCLKNCAENFDSDDMQGRMDYIDTWFNEEELQEDVDLY